MFLSILVNIFNSLTNFKLDSENQTRVVSILLKYPLYMGILTCIYAPIVEEIVFRFSIIEIFKFKIIPKFIGIIFAILIFSLAHYSFSEKINALLPYLATSSVLTYVYVKNNEIVESIYLHMIVNTIATILILLFK